jgi:cation transporter-like permease
LAIKKLKLAQRNNQQINMLSLILTPMFGAIGFSLIYLLFGGGLGGAVLIFIIAKMFGR